MTPEASPANVHSRAPRAPLSVLIPAGSSQSRVPTAGRHRPHRLQVLSEELFQNVLVREQKRADRSNQSMALVLVTLLIGVYRWMAADSAVGQRGTAVTT